MSQITPLCPKCKGAMIQGYVLDRYHGEIDAKLAHPFQRQWVKRTPAGKSRFESSYTELGFDSAKEEVAIPIGTFRCEICGFLEAYARDEFAVR